MKFRGIKLIFMFGIKDTMPVACSHSPFWILFAWGAVKSWVRRQCWPAPSGGRGERLGVREVLLPKL